jgi:anti-sigma28 factor (negative regulator of flagellin synthesis)
MKIRDIKEVAPLQAVTSPAAAPRNKEDRVSIEQTREIKETIERAKISAGAGRAAQLAAIEASVRNGTFKPNAQQIADKILQAAEVDARLRSLLD